MTRVQAAHDRRQRRPAVPHLPLVHLRRAVIVEAHRPRRCRPARHLVVDAPRLHQVVHRRRAVRQTLLRNELRPALLPAQRRRPVPVRHRHPRKRRHIPQRLARLHPPELRRHREHIALRPARMAAVGILRAILVRAEQTEAIVVAAARRRIDELRRPRLHPLAAAAVLDVVRQRGRALHLREDLVVRHGVSVDGRVGKTRPGGGAVKGRGYGEGDGVGWQ